MSEGEVALKVFNVIYETMNILACLSGESRCRGVEWVIFVEGWQMWLECDMRSGKKDASASWGIDAVAAMATGLWIKAMWIIMGWLKHNTRTDSLCILSLNEHKLARGRVVAPWLQTEHTHFITPSACVHTHMLNIQTHTHFSAQELAGASFLCIMERY